MNIESCHGSIDFFISIIKLFPLTCKITAQLTSEIKHDLQLK